MRCFAFTTVTLLSIITLSACGSTDEASTTTPPADAAADTDNPSDSPPTETQAEASDDGGEAPTGGSGTVTADGQTYGFNLVVNCEPPDAGIPNHETLLAVSALADDGVAVHVRVSEVAGRTVQDLDFYSPNGMFNGGGTETDDGWYNAVDVTSPEPPLTITDDRLTGTITVLNTRATDETLDLDVDVPYPSEITSC